MLTRKVGHTRLASEQATPEIQDVLVLIRLVVEQVCSHVLAARCPAEKVKILLRQRSCTPLLS